MLDDEMKIRLDDEMKIRKFNLRRDNRKLRVELVRAEKDLSAANTEMTKILREQLSLMNMMSRHTVIVKRLHRDINARLTACKNLMEELDE